MTQSHWVDPRKSRIVPQQYSERLVREEVTFVNIFRELATESNETYAKRRNPICQHCECSLSYLRLVQENRRPPA